MDRSGFSRRGFMKGLAVAAGSAIGARLGGRSFIGDALAATEPTSVVILHFVGGYNAIFGSAQPLQGKFGVTAGNFTALGSGLSVDNTFANSMSAFTKTHMAAIGVRHGLSAHPAARRALWSAGTDNAGLVLANAMGGTASIKAAVAGDDILAEAPQGAVGGTSFQAIKDLQKTIEALGGGAPKPRAPDRGVALAGVEGAELMSQNHLASSPQSLDSLKNGYATAIATLKKPVKSFDLPALRTAYGLGNVNAVRSFASKLAAAELMIQAGTSVVSIFDQLWDTHGDTTGTVVRNKMNSYVLAPLNVFFERVVQDATRNVVVCLLGDFSRSLPGSDHQPNLTATVIGKYVKVGSTGQVDANVRLPDGTPSIPGLWAYLAAAAKTTGAPFGADPHQLIV